MEKERIQFRPLHEGMGFHPFSDGLPYAPESKKAHDRGTGAVAAGRPRFAEPVRTARQLQAVKSTEVLRHEPINKPVAARPAVSPSPAAVPSLLRRRAFAYLLDCILHAGFWITTNLAALFLFHFQLDPTLILENLGSFLAFFTLSQWLFITMQEVLFETSAGKLFFGLEFERGHRSLLLRSLVFLFGSLTVFGFFKQPQDTLGALGLRSGSGS
jgi:hypothetical protein